MIVPDSRPRGEWQRTPWWVWWKPRWRRRVQAHWQLGGGHDNWEYSTWGRGNG